MMSDARFVRPAFARLSIVCVALLLPFVVYSVWDYAEIRRLRVRIEGIDARGESMTTVVHRPLPDQAGEAARYYSAAATLVSGYTDQIPPPVWPQIAAAERSGLWSSDVVDRLRRLIAQHAEALALLDRAAGLPFDGFQAGMTHDYLAANLMSAARLCQWRAEIRALDGQADAAFDSLVTGIRLARATNPLLELPALSVVVQRAHPSPEAAQRLGEALAEIDRDDRLKRQFVYMRAMAFDRGYNPRRSDVVLAAWDLRRLNRQLDTFAALVAAAGKPSAERRAAVMAVGEWPLPGLPGEVGRKQLEIQVASNERQTDTIRCARRLLAGEVVDCAP